MPQCHSCPVSTQIAQGKYRETPFEKTPCAKCPSADQTTHVVEYDENRLPAEPPRPEPDRDDLLPISVLTELAAGILRLSPQQILVVSRRLNGDSFRQIASSEGISVQAAAQRLKAAFRRYPAIAAAFPRKLAKQKTRRRRKTVH